MLKDGDVPFFNHENISPYLEHFLGALFNALATDENTENEYIMKGRAPLLVCLGRCVCFLPAATDWRPCLASSVRQPSCASLSWARARCSRTWRRLWTTCRRFSRLWRRTHASPSSTTTCLRLLARPSGEARVRYIQSHPHILIFSKKILLRYTCETNPAYVESFEGALFPSFEMLLQKDVVGECVHSRECRSPPQRPDLNAPPPHLRHTASPTEFQPYVFQLMAQLLELRDPPLAGPYREMFGFLLSPPLWENRANTTPLVRLICACIAKGADTLLADSSALEGILNTFRKLIFNRTLDIEGFNLVNALVEYLPLERLQPYINAIVGYLLQRTQKAKTTQFLGGFLKFVALFVAKYGGDLLIQTLDGYGRRGRGR